MKRFTIFYFTLLFSFWGTAFAGSLRTNDSQQFLNADVLRNYVVNSGAEKNLLNVTDADSILTRVCPSSGDVLDDGIYGDCFFRIDADAADEEVCFATEEFQKSARAQNFVASFVYVGDASLYTAYVKDDDGVRSGSLSLQNYASAGQSGNIGFTTPAVIGKNLQFCIKASDNAAASFDFDVVSIRPARSAEIDGSRIVVYSSANASLSAFDGTANVIWPSASINEGGIYNTSTGVTTVNLAGKYCAEFMADISTSGASANQFLTAAVKTASTTLANKVFRWENASTGSKSVDSRACINASPGDTIFFTITSNLGGASMASETFGDQLLIRFYQDADALSLNPQGYQRTSYTPTFTGMGTPTDVAFWYECVKPDLLYIGGRFTPSSTTANTATVTLPSGAANIVTVGGFRVGDWIFNSTGGSSVKTGSIIRQGSSESSVLHFTSTEKDLGLSPFTATNADALFSGDAVAVNAIVPIKAGFCSSPPAPWFKNSVTQPSVNSESIFRGKINCSGSSTITAGNGGFTSVSNISGGGCTVSYQFSGPPTCSGEISGAGGPSQYNGNLSNATSTAVSVFCNTGSGNCTAFSYDLICVGPN